MKRIPWLVMGLLLVGCTSSPKPAEPKLPAESPPAQESPAAAPIGPTESAVRLTSIYLVDQMQGWAVGTGRAPVETASLAVLRTADGGRTWHDVTPDGLSDRSGQGVAADFLDGDHGWVVVAAQAEGGGTITVYRTANGGQTWSRTEVPVLRWETGRPWVDFITPEDGWIVATSSPALGTMNKSVYRTEDGGKTWHLASRNSGPSAQPTPDPLPNTEYVTGLSFRSPTQGWVTALYRTNPETPLYRTADGGQSWHRQAIPYPPAYTEGYYANAYPPVLFGPGGTAGVLLVEYVGAEPALVPYLTRDGGTTWVAAAPVAARPAVRNDRYYDFIDLRHGWILDAGGTLLVTRDGGQAWTAITPDRSLKDAAIDFVSPEIGWALVQSTGQLLKTADGGRSWSLVAVEPKPAPRYLSRERALAIARRVDAQADWRPKLVTDFEDEGKGPKQRRPAWIVEAVHLAGNRTVVFVDAITGEAFRVMQAEGPGFPEPRRISREEAIRAALQGVAVENVEVKDARLVENYRPDHPTERRQERPCGRSSLYPGATGARLA